ncbi:MAG: hypothetical protein HBSIN02_08680 [Bacteroidia bacterium]|nr:MAG: hypothetical protein HBSIN02_08680 [Bacteroidia bacterium]
MYLAVMKPIDHTPLHEETIWYPDHLTEYLNRWFATYEQARDSLEREGGYLFPYKHHFFVCDWGAVKAMGLDPQDPDWRLIGFDCARPADRTAYGRLKEARIVACARERARKI